MSDILEKMIVALGCNTTVSLAKEISEIVNRIEIAEEQIEIMQRAARSGSYINMFGISINEEHRLYKIFYNDLEKYLVDIINKDIARLENIELKYRRQSKPRRPVGF